MSYPEMEWSSFSLSIDTFCFAKKNNFAGILILEMKWVNVEKPRIALRLYEVSF